MEGRQFLKLKKPAWKKQQWWLAIILAVVGVKQIVLATVIPPWQIPDEISHFQYVQTLVEQKTWPRLTTGPQPASREIIDSFNGLRLRYAPSIQEYITVLPYDTPSSIPSRWNSTSQPENRAAAYGPVYYIYEALPYTLFRESKIETRLLAMRLWSAGLLIILTWVAFRVGQRVRGSIGFAATLALCVGLHPKVSFIFAGVNNDALTFLLGGYIFYLFLEPQRQLSFKRVLAFAGLVGFAAMGKQSAWIFFVLGIGFLVWSSRIQKLSLGKVAQLLATFIIVSGLLGASWTIKSYRDGGDDLIGARELIRTERSETPSLVKIAAIDLTYRTKVIFHSSWDNFGWKGGRIKYHPWVVPGLAAVTSLAIVGLLLGWKKKRPNEPQSLRTALVVGIIFWACLDIFFRAIFYQRALVVGSYAFPNQGRYYFIVLIPIFLVALVGLERLVPTRWRAGVWAVAVGIMVTLMGWLLYLAHDWFNNFG